jgi:hypothetical protein
MFIVSFCIGVKWAIPTTHGKQIMERVTSHRAPDPIPADDPTPPSVPHPVPQDDPVPDHNPR